MRLPVSIAALNIFISENGIADKSDKHRPEFILSHLRALRQAQMEGVPVTGYCHWSLYDNFEWTNGYEPRFGLYEVDYSTQKRNLRPSGQLFSEIAQKNSFSISFFCLCVRSFRRRENFKS